MKQILIVVLLLTIISQVAIADAWTIEFVDDSNIIGFTSIAIDPGDCPHISYSAMDATSNGDLRYAYWNGTNWEITDVVTSGNTRNNSIALRSNGAPRIAYWDNEDWTINYISWNGSAWINTLIDGGGSEQAGPYCALCIDSQNNPSIAYYCSFPDYHLSFARRIGSTWYLSTIDPVTQVGWFLSMDLDSNDKPHVAYYDPNDDNLKYAVLGTEFWSITTVDTGGDVGMYTSIAIDSNNRPHISYYDATNGNLKYAYYNGSSWVISTVESNGDVGHWYTSIEVDDNNHPHISYYDATNSCLKYASYNGSSWEIEIVDNNGNVGAHSSLALDSQDQPHISYQESLAGPEHLKYAYYGPVGIEEEYGSEDYSFFGITPNPYTGYASISFNIPVSSDVNLNVYDLSGRQVAVLAEGSFAPGTHETEVSGLESGIYFCRMTSGDFNATQRFVVIE